MNKLVMCVLFLVTCTGCAQLIFHANFTGFSDDEPLQSNQTYDGSYRVNGDYIQTDVNGLARITEPDAIDYRSLKVVGTLSHQVKVNYVSSSAGPAGKQFTFAWSGRKHGNSRLECALREQTDTTLDVMSIIFEDGQVSVGTSILQQSLPNDVEHRVWVSVRPDTDSFSVNIAPQGFPAISGGGSTFALDNESGARIRCGYTEPSTGVSTDFYVMDDIEIRKKK